jgi:hypothetical protein
MAGREEMFAIGERARARAARLLGAGDDVVFAAVEYPSLRAHPGLAPRVRRP